MTEVFYKGKGGLLKTRVLELRNKVGTGATLIRPKGNQAWNAGGLSSSIEVVQLSRNVSEDESGKTFYGFDSAAPVLSLAAITQDGIVFRFVTNDDGTLRIDPNASNNIIYSGGSMSNGEYLQVNNSSSIFLISSGSSWIASRESGTFTEETP